MKMKRIIFLGDFLYCRHYYNFHFINKGLRLREVSALLKITQQISVRAWWICRLSDMVLSF